jgi:hypothetical protein
MTLLSLLVYVVIGLVEWWLSLRRTLAIAQGEKTLLIIIVFIENLVGLAVLATFIRSNDWMIAISYSVGGALGAYLVSLKIQKQKSLDK